MKEFMEKLNVIAGLLANLLSPKNNPVFILSERLNTVANLIMGLLKNQRKFYNTIIGGAYDGATAVTFTQFSQLFAIPYGRGKPFEVAAIVFRFKEGLETAMISIEDNDGNEILTNSQFNIIGNKQTAEITRDELPVKFTLFPGTEVRIKVKSVIPINKGDVAMTLFGNS